MSLARSLGTFLGNISGEVDVIRRSKPNVYSGIMQIVGAIIALIWVNVLITTNSEQNLKQGHQINHMDILVKRIMSLPLAMIIGWILGFLAEMSVHAQLANARQNCLHKGFTENTKEFDYCIDNINFHMQNKNDLLSRLN